MRILITAGPTREKLDPVRFLSNRSTGKMGYALAEAAREAGHEVCLISGPVQLPPPAGVERICVESAEEMAQTVFARFSACGLAILAAAVADYRPVQCSSSKIKKQEGRFLLELERTTDILAELGRRKRPDQILAGFAAETDDLEASAKGKLERKNLDWIAANLVSDGFGGDTDRIILFRRGGQRLELPERTKKELARHMIALYCGNGVQP